MFEGFNFSREPGFKYGMAGLAFIVVWSLLSILFQGSPEPTKPRPRSKPAVRAPVEPSQAPKEQRADPKHLDAIHQDLLEMELPSAEGLNRKAPGRAADSGVHIR